MWLAIKEAARRRDPEAGPPVPPMHVRQTQLGLDGAIEYRQLFEKHPTVELGPDETLEHHLSRLRAAEKDRLNEPNPDVARRQKAREEGTLRPIGPTEPDTDITSWVTHPHNPAPVAPAASDLKGMPQRIPGWFTGDAVDSPPPGYGLPPMEKRTPGAKYQPAEYAPEPRSTDQWTRWLGDQGITLNDSGKRAERPRALTGPEIWHDLVGPTTDDSYVQHLRELPAGAGGLGKSWKQRAKDFFGRRRASAEVVEYIAARKLDLNEQAVD